MGTQNHFADALGDEPANLQEASDEDNGPQNSDAEIEGPLTREIAVAPPAPVESPRDRRAGSGKKPAIPRPDIGVEAAEAIRLFNERGGATPLEIALATCGQRPLEGFTRKQKMAAEDAAEKRIFKVLYNARSKGRLTAPTPKYDTCRNNNSLLEAIQRNGFERDTPFRIDYQADEEGGPIIRIIISIL